MSQEISSPFPREEALCGYPPARLERWMREYYFGVEFDLGSSGVYSFSLGEIQELCGPSADEMAAIVFDDSVTKGAHGLCTAIARRWGNGDAAAVMATHGSSEAIHLAMSALLAPGDDVVVLHPAYPQLHAIAEHLGCLLKPWTLHPGRGFAPDLDELKSVLTPRTRAIIVNFPHNPCGVTLTPAEQQSLIEIASNVGAYLIWDGAFSDLVYAGEPLAIPNRFYEKSITLGTLSKAFGLPGLRVGWLIARPEIISACLHLRDYLTLHLSPLVELIAQRAIENADRLLALRMPSVRENLDCLRDWAARYEKWVEWIDPHAGVCAFPRLRKVNDVQAFCRRLAEEHRVLLVPGTCFEAPGHVRLGFGAAPNQFQQGLRRMTALLAARA